MSQPWWKKSKEPKQYAEWQVLKTPEGLDYYFNTRTNVTTWDKPDALKTEEELSSSGDWVWMPDEKEAYLPARVLSRQGNKWQLQTQAGSVHDLTAPNLDALKLASLQRVVSDLTLLDNMSTPLILHCLKERFNKGDIYTNIGTILISINPYQKLGLYTPEKIYEYQYRGVKEMPPHVFNIAHDAFKSLTEFGVNNSIIISGESGAGKTEATKQCLSYLAAIAGSVNGVEQKILMANPILEAFGNAKTLRNDNSSRFGKYMEVFFDNKHQIIGSTTTNYLLEKIRVVKQAPNERNYHIFYQLTKAATNDERQQLQLAGPESYVYLQSSGCLDVPGVDDVEDLGAVREAMEALQFSKQEQQSVFTIVSAILAIGNVMFRSTGDKKCDIPDKAWLDVAARLLQVESKALEKALTVKELRIRGQANTQVAQGEKEAFDARDALAKFVYGNMFNWIVQKVNASMKGSVQRGAKSIGILDIFGFEIFVENSFEQLCINYTNEMLQQHFNNNTFKLEEQVYKNERIPFTHVDFIDNQPVLDLIEAKGKGILPILDEELVVPKGSDQTFLSKMHQAHEKNPNYKKVLKNPNQFIVIHYAGQVPYDGLGFLEKNRDTLTDDLLEMLYTSKQPLLKELFPKQEVSAKDRKSSLSKQFQKQLHDLMMTLNTTEPHYIRCVKPNEFKSASTFVSRNCLEQLRYSGVFEAVAIRKQGFPFRLTHKVFYERYKCILANPDQAFPSEKKACESICDELKLNKTNVQTGQTMMLYRSDEHKQLELQYSIKVEKLRMNEMLKDLVGRDPSRLDDKAREQYFESLSRAVSKADEFNLQTDIANRARKLLDDFIESRMDDDTRALLEAAKASVNEQQLAEAIAVADHYEYATKLVKECKRLHKRVQRINQEAELALAVLEEVPMNVVLTAADEIKLSTDTVEYFRDLLTVQPKETFIKMQMGVAARLKDHHRSIRITIRLKDILFEKQKDSAMFNIENFGRLKNPVAWAAEKLFNFGAEDRARGMLRFTKDSVHSSLIEFKNADPKVNKALSKKATAAFGMIQKFMGDRKDKDDVGTGREVVSEGWSNVPLRDEIYLQIIKQLTDNPNMESARKGWDLMGLCLTTFPPGPDFENFLEVYLRKHSQPAVKYVGALHKIIYEGAVAAPPSLEAMQQIEQTLTSRSRGFSEPLPPAQPSYQDLLEPYYSQGPIANEFSRKAPKASSPANAGPKPPTPKVKPCLWVEAQDPDTGLPYYYHTETGESTWDRPPEMNPVMGRISVVSRGW